MMPPRRTWAWFAGVAFLFGCDLLTSPPTHGWLSLAVVRADAAPPSTVDAARVRITGPTGDAPQTTTRNLTFRDGVFLDTIAGLVPGSYTIALEGLSGGLVEEFGQTTGAMVKAGQSNLVTIPVASFRPLVLPPAQVTDSLAIVVDVGDVAGAVSYIVALDYDSTFVGPAEDALAASEGTSYVVGIDSESIPKLVEIRVTSFAQAAV